MQCMLLEGWTPMLWGEMIVMSAILVTFGLLACLLAQFRWAIV